MKFMWHNRKLVYLILIISMFFFSEIKSQETKHCYKLFKDAVEVYINHDFTISSQADGIFLFKVNFEVKQYNIIFINIESRYNFSPIDEDIMNALKKIKTINTYCEGKYSFLIIINSCFAGFFHLKNQQKRFKKSSILFV